MYSNRENVLSAWFYSTQTYRYPSYRARPNLGFAVSQLVLGCLCIAFNIALILVYSSTGPIAAGIWGGIFMIITGSFGIAAVCNKGKCTVMTTLIMSIIASVMGLVVGIISAIGVAFDSLYYYYQYHGTSLVPLGVCLMVFGVSEVVIAILQAVYSGRAMRKSTSFCEGGQQTENCIALPGYQQPLPANQQLFAYVQGQMVPVRVTQQPVTVVAASTSARQVARAPLDVTQLTAQSQAFNLPEATPAWEPEDCAAPPAYTASAAGEIAGVHQNK